MGVLFNPVFIAGWVIFSLICGIMGATRKTGFWGTMLLALLFSPLLVLLFLNLFQPATKNRGNATVPPTK